VPGATIDSLTFPIRSCWWLERFWHKENAVSNLPKIKNRLRKHRKLSGLTQKQVACMLGLSSSAQISRWEKGERLPTLKHALQLAALYNRLVTDLFFDLFNEERELMAGKKEVRHCEDYI
jgi:transcriptional regulator with XRE-family HTH domain